MICLCFIRKHDVDVVRQSIANFSYIYTLSLLQEKRKIEKKGKKEEIREEKEKWNYFIHFFLSSRCQLYVFT